MRRFYIGLGSNIGDSKCMIERALGAIEGKGLGEVVVTSSLYLTEPVGDKDQPWFINAVAIIEAECEPASFLDELKKIELELGRKRENERKYGPRTIDLDIIFVDNQIIEEEGLKVPHPRMPERRFVLEPLAEIDPDFRHPVLKKTIKELLVELKDSHKVKRLKECINQERTNKNGKES